MSAHAAKSRVRSRRHPGAERRAGRRAFTLMEVMLAGSLGLIVIFAVMAFFTTMDKAKKHQAVRMEVNAEMATAHRVIQQALRSLIMADVGEGNDEQIKERIEQDLRAAKGDLAEQRDENAQDARLALQPDQSKRTGAGRSMQSLELVVSTPPVHALTRSPETEADNLEAMYELERMRERQINLFGGGRRSAGGSSRTDSSRSASSSRSGSGSSRERNPGGIQATSGGKSTTDAGGKLIDPALDPNAVEPPRAPGVRGVFELRSETDPVVLARAGDVPGGSQAWALWWRQIPPEDDLLPETDQNAGVRDRNLLALARASRTDGPETKLLSGIKSAHWQVYRRREFVQKMMASNARELPAYVEFRFETIDGRREDWMFEVAWSYGAEPGTVVAVNDPLNNPGGAAGDPRLALLGQLGLTNADGSIRNPNNPNQNTGTPTPTPTTGGGRPTTGGGGSGSMVDNGNGTITITLPNGQSITLPKPGGR